MGALLLDSINQPRDLKQLNEQQVKQLCAETRQVKPDLAAPGVDIITAKAGGGYEAVTGTSFAAPFVTGSAALLMQWGIVDGNDPFLYGEKVKVKVFTEKNFCFRGSHL